MTDVIYDGGISTKRDNSNGKNSNSNMNSISYKKVTKKVTTKKKPNLTKKELEQAKKELETESSTSEQVITEEVQEPEIELTEEEKKKLEFRLSAEGEKLLDNYIKLLKKYKVDLNNYQKKEDDLKIDTLRALMTQDEIVT